jgi:hypothetical protein
MPRPGVENTARSMKAPTNSAADIFRRMDRGRCCEPREAEGHHEFRDREGHPEGPHVPLDDRWIGHDWGRHGNRYHVAPPCEKGDPAVASAHGHVFRLEAGIVSGRRLSLARRLRFLQ